MNPPPLQAWPNFTLMVECTPESSPVATLWSRTPLTITSTAQHRSQILYQYRLLITNISVALGQNTPWGQFIFYVTDGNIMYLTDASRFLISCVIQHYALVVGWGGGGTDA